MAKASCFPCVPDPIPPTDALLSTAVACVDAALAPLLAAAPLRTADADHVPEPDLSLNHRLPLNRGLMLGALTAMAATHVSREAHPSAVSRSCMLCSE